MTSGQITTIERLPINFRSVAAIVERTPFAAPPALLCYKCDQLAYAVHRGRVLCAEHYVLRDFRSWGR